MKAHIKMCKKMLNFIRIFLNIHDFFDFFKVFRTKLFCTVSYSYVLCIRRFLVKFHIGMSMSGHGGRRDKNSFISKTVKNGILRGLRLRRFTQNQINPHQKTSQNHRTLITSNKGNFHEKPPTHIRATYAISNVYKNFYSRIPRESGQNFYIIRFSIIH